MLRFKKRIPITVFKVIMIMCIKWIFEMAEMVYFAQKAEKITFTWDGVT